MRKFILLLVLIIFFASVGLLIWLNFKEKEDKTTYKPKNSIPDNLLSYYPRTEPYETEDGTISEMIEEEDKAPTIEENSKISENGYRPGVVNVVRKVINNNTPVEIRVTSPIQTQSSVSASASASANANSSNSNSSAEIIITPDKVDPIEPPTDNKICVNKCGDGIGQTIVCLGSGCPCAETPQSCPQDF